MCHKVSPMVFILDGNSEMGAHVLGKFGNLICLRHWFSSRVDTDLIFSGHNCATCSDIPSNIITMVSPNMK